MIKRAVAGLVAAAALALGAAGDPLAGFWRLNLAKSNLPPPLPRSQTALIEVRGDRISIREDIVNERGELLTITLEAGFDGEDYPIHGSPFADTVAYERVDDHTLRCKVKKAGRVITNEKVVVSADGLTMTGTYSGIDATGRSVTATAVFDRR
jgi:hypothetical protein